MQPGPGPSGVPWALLVAPPPVTDPDEHDVALADPDLLIPLGCEHIRHGHVVTGLQPGHAAGARHVQDRKSTRLNSSHPSTSYAVFCLKKKKKKTNQHKNDSEHTTTQTPHT